MPIYSRLSSNLSSLCASLPRSFLLLLHLFPSHSAAEQKDTYCRPGSKIECTPDGFIIGLQHPLQFLFSNYFPEPPRSRCHNRLRIHSRREMSQCFAEGGGETGFCERDEDGATESLGEDDEGKANGNSS